MRFFEDYIDEIAEILYLSEFGINKVKRNFDTCNELECDNCIFGDPSEPCSAKKNKRYFNV